MYLLGAVAPRLQPKSRFVIVTAGRSGSELLTDLLNSHPAIVCDAEILHERQAMPERFVAGRAAKAGLGGAQAYGFKIHCGHFGYQFIREHPGYLSQMSKSGAHLIWLRREDLLAQAISSTVANHTRWHWREDDHASFEAPEVDPVEVLMMTYLFEESDAFLGRLVAGLPHLTLVYERDLLDGTRQQATVHRICAHLGVEEAPTRSDHVRYTPSALPDTVKNWDAVAELIGSTRFGRFVDTGAGAGAGKVRNGVGNGAGGGDRPAPTTESEPTVPSA